VWFDHIGTFMSDEITMEERLTYGASSCGRLVAQKALRSS